MCFIIECSICSKGFKRYEAFTRSAGCGHVFHENCLVASLLAKEECPKEYCRKQATLATIEPIYFTTLLSNFRSADGLLRIMCSDVHNGIWSAENAVENGDADDGIDEPYIEIVNNENIDGNNDNDAAEEISNNETIQNLRRLLESFVSDECFSDNDFDSDSGTEIS